MQYATRQRLEVDLMQLAPYLFFTGTCEEALQFYATVLHGEVVGLQRYGDAPTAAQTPEAERDLVMHASFEAPGITFMASDRDGPTVEMTRVALSLATSDVDEGSRVFTALADGGHITQPYSKQFWGASFGMLVDRFGIHWMVNAGP